MDEAFFRIGFSGHQDLGNEATRAFVAQSLRELLMSYLEQANACNQELLLYAALAPGADQLCITIALELAIAVEAVIPCAEYERIFTDADAVSAYHQLLARCRKIHPLPAQQCSDEAFLEAGHWIVEHADLVLLVWNGYPAAGKGGTADVASYARSMRRPFLHIHTREHTIKHYGSLQTESKKRYGVPRRELAVSEQVVYRGPVLQVKQYRWQLPDRDEIVRDIVERPVSVLVLPVSQKRNVLLIEEYDLGAGTWQLTLPGGKVDDTTPEGLAKQAEVELREETGYRPGKLEKLLDFYSHPGYIAHKVHVFVAHDLEWDPLELEDGEELFVRTFTLNEALETTRIDYRVDPEAALALWVYAGQSHTAKSHHE
jgi:8-oxo-dGTP pyrophosphatase MutT (NUDIX family)